MLYPLSYEGRGLGSVFAVQTISAVLGRSARCPVPALGVPVRRAGGGAFRDLLNDPGI